VAHAIVRRSEEELARERTRQRILFRQQLVRVSLDAYVARFVVAVLSEPHTREVHFCVAKEGQIRIVPLP
jgi:hypothetical protein